MMLVKVCKRVFVCNPQALIRWLFARANRGLAGWWISLKLLLLLLLLQLAPSSKRICYEKSREENHRCDDDYRG